MLCGDHAEVGKRIYEEKQGTDYFKDRIGTLSPGRREKRPWQRSISHHGGDFFIFCVFILITLLYRWQIFRCKCVLNSGIQRVSTDWALASLPSGVLCGSSDWRYCDLCSPDCAWQRMLASSWEMAESSLPVPEVRYSPKGLASPARAICQLLLVCF